MSFSNLSLLGVLAGIGALAALLFLLQQLRIRYSELRVPTTMFWAAAVREAPVRVFRKRFRHLLAYLLSLAIVSLLWLGFAGPERSESRSGGYHVLFLDGSAHMGGEGLLEEAIAELRADLSVLPEERREVIWGGAYNLKILDAGEDSLLLDRRLETLAPESVPSGVDAQLRVVTEQVSFVIYGRAPVSPDVLAGLPTGIAVTRGTDLPSEFRNAGIAELGVAPAASGRWDAVDVLVGLAGTAGFEPDPALLEFRIDGQTLDDIEPEHAGDGRVVLRDLPADGGVIEARLGMDDDLEIDNRASLRLPERTVIGVALSGAVPAPLVRVIENDPGLEWVAETEADVAVRAMGEPFGAGSTAFELAPMDQLPAAFTIDYDGGEAIETALQDTVMALGLDQIDHSGLATDARRPIEAVMEQSEQRRVAVWAELLGDGFNFTGSRSFPAFVARAIRWLAGDASNPPYLAAGRPLGGTAANDSLEDASNRRFEVLGAAFVPARAGTIEHGGREWPVALLDRGVTTGAQGAEIEPAGMDFGVRAAGVGLVSLLILAALALLVAEWILYRRGLMP